MRKLKREKDGGEKKNVRLLDIILRGSSVPFDGDHGLVLPHHELVDLLEKLRELDHRGLDLLDVTVPGLDVR